jgi:HSP20 family protein
LPGADAPAACAGPRREEMEALMFLTRNALVPDLTPWRELSTLPNRVARLFGEPFTTTFTPENMIFNPAIDVTEQDEALIITAELPGMKKEEVELQIVNGVLTIRGEKKQEKEKKTPRMHVFERAYGVFERAFALPQSVDLEKVKAEFENGVLTIIVPKLAQEKGRKVQILEK